MRGIVKIAANLIRYVIVAATLSIVGCATHEPPQPLLEPVVQEPVEFIPAPEPIPGPVEIIPVIPEPPVLPGAAIVLTNTQPAHADVAQETP